MLILGWIINVKQQHKRRVFAQCCQPQRLVGCLQTGFQTMGCERREGQNPRASLKEAHATLLLFLLLVVAPFGTSLCMQKASQDCTLLYSLWEAEIKIRHMWDSLKDTTDVQMRVKGYEKKKEQPWPRAWSQMHRAGQAQSCTSSVLLLICRNTYSQVTECWKHCSSRKFRQYSLKHWVKGEGSSLTCTHVLPQNRVTLYELRKQSCSHACFSQQAGERSPAMQESSRQKEMCQAVLYFLSSQHSW